MRANRRRIERLCAGGVIASPAGGFDPLSHLVAAVRVPAALAELAGEDAAAAAFREAGLAAVAPGPPRALRKGPSPARSFTVKALVVTAALTSAGGVALAASGGPPLPSPAPGDRMATRSPGRPAPSGEDAGPPAATPGARRPSPSIAGLCRAHRRHDGERGAAFSALARRAGGADKVDAYCARVLGPDGDPGRPRERNDRAPARTGSPSGKVRAPVEGPAAPGTRSAPIRRSAPVRSPAPVPRATGSVPAVATP